MDAAPCSDGHERRDDCLVSVVDTLPAVERDGASHITWYRPHRVNNVGYKACALQCALLLAVKNNYSLSDDTRGHRHVRLKSLCKREYKNAENAKKENKHLLDINNL